MKVLQSIIMLVSDWLPLVQLVQPNRWCSRTAGAAGAAGPLVQPDRWCLSQTKQHKLLFIKPTCRSLVRWLLATDLTSFSLLRELYVWSIENVVALRWQLQQPSAVHSEERSLSVCLKQIIFYLLKKKCFCIFHHVLVESAEASVVRESWVDPWLRRINLITYRWGMFRNLCVSILYMLQHSPISHPSPSLLPADEHPQSCSTMEESCLPPIHCPTMFTRTKCVFTLVEWTFSWCN